MQTAQDIYGGLSPYRNAAGAALLTQPSQASLASLYGNNPTYSPVGNAGITNAGNAATATLNDLTTTLNDLTTAAPNYEAQAMQTLKDFQTAAQPQLALGIRDINQAAGETGRVGAEGVTTSLGDLATTYANNLQAEENALASQTAQQQFGAEQAANQAAQAANQAALGQQGQLFGEAAQQQGVQNQLGQNAIQNTMGETGQQLGRGLSLAQLGYSNSPVGAYETGANSDAANSAAQGKAAGGFAQGLGTLASLFLG